MAHPTFRIVHDRQSEGARSLLSTLADLIMANITLGDLESRTGGVLIAGSRSAIPSSISIDSRTLKPGELFFAIRGRSHDGHSFINMALSKGALGVVIDDRCPFPTDFPGDRILLQVQDTHEALKTLAAEVRSQWQGSLIAITGSMGKTTTKEFASHVLQTEFNVYHSPGNYNNLFGLPLSLFGLSSDNEIGIFEMGMSARGEIAEMCRIARPDVGIITNVAPVHLEFFGSVEEIARAKEELAEGLSRDGTLIYNADDALVREIAGRYTGRKISFGRSVNALVRAEAIEILSVGKTRFRLHQGGSTIDVTIPLAGFHYVMNALPAVALGSYYGMALDRIAASLKHIATAPMRGQILRFGEQFTVIDDSYNSNPRALMEMVESLFHMPCRRRILVAGEMLELGPDSGSIHFQCGSWLAQQGIDVLVTVQGMASEMARGAREGGMPESNVHVFTEAHPAGDFVARMIQAGDLVLVKGSRGVHLEKVVLELRSRHAEWII